MARACSALGPRTSGSGPSEPIATEEIALAVGASLEEVAAVLRVLQSTEPAGIGARNVRECLLLQLSLLTVFVN